LVPLFENVLILGLLSGSSAALLGYGFLTGREDRLVANTAGPNKGRTLMDALQSRRNLTTSVTCLAVIYCFRRFVAGPVTFLAVLWTAVSWGAAILERERKGRWRESVRAQWPSMLEGMAAVAQAGLDLPQAFQIASRRTTGSLRAEMEKVNRRLEGGQSLGKALLAMERNGVTEAKRLSSMLMQAEILGTPVSMVLQSLAEESQDAIYQEDQERFNALPVRLSVATVVFLLPPVLIVSIVPHVLSFLRSRW
jgi:pilus assembly protein TadC